MGQGPFASSAGVMADTRFAGPAASPPGPPAGPAGDRSTPFAPFAGETTTNSEPIAPNGDLCPDDPLKTAPLVCGCGNPDRDSDADGVVDCADECPDDPAKTVRDACGCGGVEDNSDDDCGGQDAASAADQSTGACAQVQTPVPDEVAKRLELDPFYRKFADAGGLPIIASAAPSDDALLAACRLVDDMLSERDDVREALKEAKVRFAIIGRNEGTADIPEYGYRGRPVEDIDAINQRARGLGGQVASCGEENILCLEGDRYWNESICVHEFAHTISTYGLYRVDRGFEARLQATFDGATRLGLWANTYALENLQEYWAEGVQCWYDTNDEAIPANGIHNEIDTRTELVEYDRELYGLIDELLPEATTFDDCHRQ